MIPHNVVIMLGSNTDISMLLSAKSMLEDWFDVVAVSEIMETSAMGEQYQSPFYNQAIRIKTEYDREETIRIFKKTEKKLGRTSESKTDGIVPIDIDLIVWNGDICHDDYYRYDFVKKCVDEIT